MWTSKLDKVEIPNKLYEVLVPYENMIEKNENDLMDRTEVTKNLIRYKQGFTIFLENLILWNLRSLTSILNMIN